VVGCGVVYEETLTVLLYLLLDEADYHIIGDVLTRGAELDEPERVAINFETFALQGFVVFQLLFDQLRNCNNIKAKGLL
jgi:hypothetical protein